MGTFCTSVSNTCLHVNLTVVRDSDHVKQHNAMLYEDENGGQHR